MSILTPSVRAPAPVDRFLERVVFVGGDEKGRALLGDDLHGDLIGIDLFDERGPPLAGLAGSDGPNASIDSSHQTLAWLNE
jgi:hypothetical protein